MRLGLLGNHGVFRFGRTQGEGLFYDFANGQVIPSQFTFTRGPSDGNAWSVNSSGNWIESAANVARFDNTFPAPINARGLLMEGQRSNVLRNPRGEGAVVGVIGSGGALPTNWSASSLGTREIVATGSEFGLQYVDIRQSGTGGAAFEWFFEASNFALAAVGQTWSASLFFRLIGGSFAGWARSPNLVMYEFPSTALSSVSTSLSSSITRPTVTRTLNQATTTSVQHRLNFATPPVGAWDFTIRIYSPQIEQAAFSSTPIFPPASSLITSTRAADLLSGLLSGLNIGSSGAGTYLIEISIPQAAPAGTSQTLIQIDDGGASNRFGIRNSAGSSLLDAYRVTAGALLTSTAVSFTANTVVTCGISVDGSGSILFSSNGSAPVSLSGAPVSGLTTFRVGSSSGAATTAFSYFRKMRIIQRAFSSSELQNATAAAL